MRMVHPEHRMSILKARAELERRPVYLDTETTGLDARDEIIEICVLDHDGSVLVDSLVKPKGRIPISATLIHGITDDMVRDAPSWPEIWPIVQIALAGKHVAIYNADFDIRMLKQSLYRYRIPWLPGDWSWFCVMLLYADFRGDRGRRRGEFRWYSLEQAVYQCRIHDVMQLAHRARADAYAARAVLHHMAGQPVAAF